MIDLNFILKKTKMLFFYPTDRGDVVLFHLREIYALTINAGLEISFKKFKNYSLNDFETKFKDIKNKLNKLEEISNSHMPQLIRDIQVIKMCMDRIFFGIRHNITGQIQKLGQKSPLLECFRAYNEIHEIIPKMLLSIKKDIKKRQTLNFLIL